LQKRNTYRLLVGKSKEKRPSGRRHRWADNIKMDLRERGWGGMDWISLATDKNKWWAPLNAVMNLRVPQNAAKIFSSQLVGSWVVLSSI
jgi:hypothetical protein